jgi:serine/threonine protein kinase
MADTQNEYEIMSKLAFYSIPKVNELILNNDYFYSIICMEYSNIGMNVLQLVNTNRLLEESEVKMKMKEPFKTIEYIRNLDYDHRDVKSDNVLIKVINLEKEESKDVKVILFSTTILRRKQSHLGARLKRTEKTDRSQSNSGATIYPTSHCRTIRHLSCSNLILLRK